MYDLVAVYVDELVGNAESTPVLYMIQHFIQHVQLPVECNRINMC